MHWHRIHRHTAHADRQIITYNQNHMSSSDTTQPTLNGIPGKTESIDYYFMSILLRTTRARVEHRPLYDVFRSICTFATTSNWFEVFSVQHHLGSRFMSNEHVCE